jgi:hypothetical protein
MISRSILAFGVMVCLEGWCCQTHAAPSLAVDQSEFDFGFVPQNSKISHTFHLQNVGDDTLRISKVVPGCGCTKAPLKKAVLAPGESTEVEIIFSTGQYNGRVTKRPRLETNEVTPSRNLTFHATVVARPDSTYPIQVKPYKLDISPSGQMVRDQLKFSISNVSEQPVSINLISSANDLMTVTVPKQVAAGKTAQGRVKLSASALTQSFETSFTLQLDDSTATRFTIPLKRTVQKDSFSSVVL